VKRIERLEAESEIRKVVHNYCLLQDKRELDRFLGILTDDFCLAFAGWNLEVKGKENVKNLYLENIFPGFEYNIHQVTNVNIEVDGDEATAETYHILHLLTAQGDLQEAYGRYVFKLRKEAGVWKLAGVDTFSTLWNGSQAPQDPSAYERFPWPPK
jgi:ketosteroid isomerase-like protein